MKGSSPLLPRPPSPQYPLMLARVLSAVVNGMEAFAVAGQTHLNSPSSEQIGMIPAGVELFAPDAALFGFLSFEHVQSKTAQSSEVLHARPRNFL